MAHFAQQCGGWRRDENRGAVMSGNWRNCDRILAGTTLLLVSIGWIMVTSASLNIAEQQQLGAFHYAVRQAVFLLLGVIGLLIVLRIPARTWERQSVVVLTVSLLLLVVVLVPGIGREVNGSHRWLPLGIVNLQVSEIAKLAAVVFLAGYISRHRAHLDNAQELFFKPMGLLVLMASLLLMEPDFGTTVVVVSTCMGMLFLAGAPLRPFVALGAGLAAALIGLVVLSPYRWERIRSFLHACDEEYAFDQGYQLCQALIAFGRGEVFGVGLGNSVQKMFYLPEAHTDFVLAVLGEELGVLGTLSIIVLFGIWTARVFRIGTVAERQGETFMAFACYGVAMWVAIQAFINIGVNLGALPTKGITLPFLSYGGSSMIVMLLATGLILRIDQELRDRSQTLKGKQVWAPTS